MAGNAGKLSIIPLGGLGEIGKNMTVIRYGKNIILIDAGLMFPQEEMLGIDLVIPDITYLLENRDMIKGIVLTHGHEDHIGALPYVLKQINIPVYATKLTLGLVEGKLKEHGGLLEKSTLNCVKPGDSITVGCFQIDFIRVNHSIPDAVALAIQTPVGLVVHTGDFKFDQTPVNGEVADFHKFTELGNKGVLVLFSDSTNAERPGFTLSEKNVGATIEDVFRSAKGRIIVATFASNVHRLQQVCDAALKHNRKVAFVGRSMENVARISLDLGYLTVPEDLILEIDDVLEYPDDEIVVLTTGSQGEPMSALTRMAMSEHKKIEIVPGDTVIIAANPIPGNEKLVARSIDHLFRRGADVIYESVSGVHVSGHASQEELKLMLNFVRPKFFIPVHGEYRHLMRHAQVAREIGLENEQIFIAENGSIIEFTKDKGAINGKVTAGAVLVDGFGVGDVGNIVLRDRKQLSQDGILIVVVTIAKETCSILVGPEIVSRGFVYVREAEALMEEAREKVKAALERTMAEKVSEWAALKSCIKEALSRHLYEKTGRRPMILPIIMEV